MKEKRTYLYLVRMAGTDFYKIGISQHLKRRISALQTGNPYAIELVVAEPVRRPVATEMRMHGEFAPFLENGEWFRFTPETADLARSRIDYFKDRAALAESLLPAIRQEIAQMALPIDATVPPED